MKFLPSLERFSLLVLNPFVFFATAYSLLDPNYHAWMGTFAVGMALIYAGAAKLLLDRKATTRTEFVLMIGVSLAFITLAIPIQLESNWITIAWAVEGLVILWAGVETRSALLRTVAHSVFGLAVTKLVFGDMPYGDRADFTPVLNKYFLSSLFVTACLFAGALVYQRLGERKQTSARVFQLVLLMIAIITLVVRPFGRDAYILHCARRCDWMPRKIFSTSDGWGRWRCLCCGQSMLRCLPRSVSSGARRQFAGQRCRCSR